MKLQLPKFKTENIQAIQQANDIIMLTSSNTLYFVSKTNSSEPYYEKELDQNVKNIEVSESGDYLIVSTQGNSYVFHVQKKQLLLSTSDKITFFKHDNDDCLIRLTATNEMSIVKLSHHSLVHKQIVSDAYNHLTLNCIDHIIFGFGYYKGESTDGLYIYPIDRLNDKTVIKKKVIDAAEILICGKSDDHSILVYRDPLDSEEDYEEEDYEEDELLNFRGIYKINHSGEIFYKLPLVDKDIIEINAIGNKLLIFFKDRNLKILDQEGNVLRSFDELQAYGINFGAKEVIICKENDIEILSLSDTERNE